MRPDDLLGRRQVSRDRVVRETRSSGCTIDRGAELATAGGDDAARPAKLVFLRRQRLRIVGLALCDVRDLPRLGIERELVPVPGIGNCLRTLDDVQPEIQRVAAEDVPHVVAADDHHLEPDFFGDRLQAGRAHFARRPDREPIAGDDERLAAMDAGAKVRHQVAKRASLPSLVERFERFGHAVGGRRDLVGVDGVALPAVLGAGKGRIPENQGLATDEAFLRIRRPRPDRPFARS